ncbi:START domain-containing protein [Colwellia asteriadis]|uniref:START domain-containing protein n=1 Tax=Colwellia asteriadis TaxID=517723 RepID=A0ABN1LAQ8_9GAMM
MPWTVWEDNRHLSVSYRDAQLPTQQSAAGLIEIQAKLSVESSLAGFLLFLQDVDNTPNWLKGAQESKILTHASASEQSFFVTFSKIWPLKPRLLLLHSRFWQNDDLSVDMSVTQLAPPENLTTALDESIDDFFIVTIHHAHWKLTPKLQGGSLRIAIEYTVIADGGGNAPTWLANHMALKSIWKSMHALQQQLPHSHWQSKKISNIKELK